MKKTNTASRLKEIMRERNLRQIDILTAAAPYCKQYNVKLGKNDLSQYVNGKSEPGQRKLTVLGLALKVSPVWLMGYDVPINDSPDPDTNNIPSGFIPVPQMQRIPIIGTIACGDPITAEENIEGYAEAPADRHVDFALKCQGDSMIDAGIKDGDVVYIRKQPQVENGQIAAVRIDNEATLKRVYFHGDTLILQPANSNYPPRSFSGTELENVVIEGLAVGFTHWM